MPKVVDLGSEEDFDEMVERDAFKALEKCRRDWNAAALSLHEQRWWIIQRTTKAALRMAESSRQMNAFLNDEFWNIEGFERYELQEKNIIRYNMQYLLNAPHRTSRQYNTACAYAAVVEHLFAENVKPNNIFINLHQRGGIKGIHEEYKQKKNPGSVDSNKAEPFQNGNGNDNDSGKKRGDGSGEGIGRGRGAMPPSADLTSSTKTGETKPVKRVDLKRDMRWCWISGQGHKLSRT